MNSVLKDLAKRLPGSHATYRGLMRTAAWQRWWSDYLRFHRLAGRANPRFPLRFRDRHPCLDDRTAVTGFDRHYVYHTAWAARTVAAISPKVHLDIGSSLFFAGVASAFVPIRFFDYRPADIHLSNLASEAADLLNLPFADRSIDSLSCMHVLEHVGLGRYGDPLDPDGDVKAMAQLQRVVAPGGSLLVVVPVGAARIQFNAHRIYSYQLLMENFSQLSLVENMLVPDEVTAPPIRNAPPELFERQSYGCGCFWFKRTTDSPPLGAPAPAHNP